MAQHWQRSLTRLGKRLQGQLQPLRSRLLQDPYYRFQSIEELQLAAQLGVAIDANQAMVDDWLRLPGMSIHQARALVALRQSGVQFHSLEDVAAALSVPLQRLQPLQPILRFCYYDAASPCTPPPVPLNTASAEQLSRVPAIDLFLARAIVEERDRHGRFQTMADLQQRMALPADLMGNVMHYLTL